MVTEIPGNWWTANLKLCRNLMELLFSYLRVPRGKIKLVAFMKSFTLGFKIEFRSLAKWLCCEFQ